MSDRLYIEWGKLPKVNRFGFAVKTGKGKVLAASPSFGARGTARTKALRMMNRLHSSNEIVVWEVPELRA